MFLMCSNLQQLVELEFHGISFPRLFCSVSVHRGLKPERWPGTNTSARVCSWTHGTRNNSELGEGEGEGGGRHGNIPERERERGWNGMRQLMVFWWNHSGELWWRAGLNLSVSRWGVLKAASTHPCVCVCPSQEAVRQHTQTVVISTSWIFAVGVLTHTHTLPAGDCWRTVDGEASAQQVIWLCDYVTL